MVRSTSLLRSLLVLSFTSVAVSLGGCQLIAGLGGEEPLDGGAGGTEGGTGGETTAMGGNGGTGGGTGLTGPCTPDETVDCYSGPDGTRNVGACKGGVSTCSAEATWGKCDGEVVPELESCAAPEDENCDTLDCLVWLKVFEGEVYGEVVDVGDDGSVIAGVTFATGTDFGDGMPSIPVGSSDIALLKLDKYGALVWKRVFPASDAQAISALDIDKSGNIVFSGYTYGPITFGNDTIPVGGFVVKMDPEGVPTWARGATSESGTAIIDFVASDSQGNVFAAGTAKGIDFGTGLQSGGMDPYSFYIAKLAADTGTPSWVKITKGGGWEFLNGLAVDPSDSAVIIGTFDGQYLGFTDGATPPNDLYNGSGEDRPFLARVDPSGKLGNGKHLATGPNGTIVTLYTNGVVTDNFGAAFVGGSFSGTVQLQSGAYTTQDGGAILIHDQVSGFDQWAKAFGAAGAYAGINRVALDGAGNVVLSGNYGGPVDFGGGPLPDGYSSFLTKLGKDGAFQWAKPFKFGDGGIQDMAAGTLENEAVIIGTFYGMADILGTFIDKQQGVFIAKVGY
ncbi:MAG: hypothetical protein R3F14_03435 [Polyangiaceae bacterium]